MDIDYPRGNQDIFHVGDNVGAGAGAGTILGTNQDINQVGSTVGIGAGVGTASGAILCLPVTIEPLCLANVSDTSNSDND